MNNAHCSLIFWIASICGLTSEMEKNRQPKFFTDSCVKETADLRTVKR